MQTYTFVCLNARRASTVVDIAHLEAGDCRNHAEYLLARHASAERIEIWNEAELVDMVDRTGQSGARQDERETRPTPAATGYRG